MSRIPAAIRAGQSYLLDRLRRNEITASAPAGSANRFDGFGHPFLTLDPVIAVRDLLTVQDRDDVVSRLLGQERAGKWAYADFAGVDADTTASAIRTLDRLSHSVDLSGIDSFYNAASRLHQTFEDAHFVDRNLGLQLPPQDLKKHRGSHPCVLANVNLLLLERGRLAELDVDFLRSVQRADGNWYSYCYPSPFYATRLYTELLASLGPGYDSFLEATLTALLTNPCPTTPTQTAESLLALAHLRGRNKSRASVITETARAQTDSLLRTQLEDGSWVGDVIWEFVDENDTMLVAFDNFSARSTALCVRALLAWS
jgi:hypothetical protein